MNLAMDNKKVVAYSIIGILLFSSLFFYTNTITGNAIFNFNKFFSRKNIQSSSLESIVVSPPPVLATSTSLPPSVLTTGELHACFLSIKADTIWCWGGFRYFYKEVIKEVELIDNKTNKTVKELQQVKILETVTYSTPYIINDGKGQPFRGAISISAGSSHTCALKNDGTVWCWPTITNFENNNLRGQLGDGTNTASEFPVQVLTSKNPTTPLRGIKAISVGDSHTCALKNDSTLWCWGGNYFGQLGDGTTKDSSLPVRVKLP